MFFVGFAVSAGFVPRISDKFGRKWPYLGSLILQTGAYVLIFFSKNIYGTLVYYLLVGLSAGGRVVIGTNYMNEFLAEKYQVTLTTILSCSDSSVMIW